MLRIVREEHAGYVLYVFRLYVQLYCVVRACVHGMPECMCVYFYVCDDMIQVLYIESIPLPLKKLYRALRII